MKITVEELCRLDEDYNVAVLSWSSMGSRGQFLDNLTSGPGIESDIITWIIMKESCDENFISD